MKKIIIVLLVFCSFIGNGVKRTDINVQSTNEDLNHSNININRSIVENNNVEWINIEEDLIVVEWERSEFSYFTEDSIIFMNERSFFEEFNINEEDIAGVDKIKIQKENLYFDEYLETAPDGWGFNSDGELGLFSKEHDRLEYTHPKGYVQLVTKAFQVGFWDNNLVYRIEGEANLLKGFSWKKEDALVIQHGYNASEHPYSYPKGEVWRYYSDLNKLKIEPLDPNYNGYAGVDYKFQYNRYGSNRVQKVKGEYIIAASDSTSVKVSYVHAYKSISRSLDISYDGIGTSITSQDEIDVMNSRPLGLEGAKGEITGLTDSLSPDQYGYESQYFFYQKSANHILDNIGNMTTSRLRTGYIEEERINLSAKRYNAGEAYLEYKFEKKIHKFTIELSLWSSNEGFTPFDTAYIQYKNNKGEWINIFDILDKDNGVPTDRTDPEKYTFYFLEGVNEIRIISKTIETQSERNKGRIAIKNCWFTSYERKES